MARLLSLLLLFLLLVGAAACGDDRGPPIVVRDAGVRRDAGPRTDGGARLDGGRDAGDRCATVDCSAWSDECNVGVCDTSDGSCRLMPRPDPTACDDGDACTTGDMCMTGFCGGAETDCTDLDDVCVIGQCNASSGVCEAAPRPGMVTCDDGSACTTGDMCDGGACRGAPVDCGMLEDDCNAAMCDPTSGACIRTPRTDGTVCDDGVPCTTVDRCTAGACAGRLVDCSFLDGPCVRGDCDDETGLCGPVPFGDGMMCDDGSACSTGDTCRAGACTGTPVMSPTCSMVTVNFPQVGDTRVGPGGGLYFWMLGDHVEGSRMTTLPSVGRADISLQLEMNGLTCDTQDVELRINGTAVGTFSIAGGDTTIARSFMFPPIAGPTYTLRYHTVRTVAGGCGASGYSNTGSTVTLRP